MPQSKIELTQVSKAFQGQGLTVQALEGLSLHVNAEEFVTLIGPSGSGKSTIFNLIVGLLQPDSGEICIDGEVCHERVGRVGYMPQRDLLLPWRTVLDNAIIPLELQGAPRQQARAQAHELLPRFGLEGFEKSYPAALSGGMRQRAALLRTILGGRDILLLDEPFGALDALTRRKLQDWLLDLQREMQWTILFITHDVEEAVYLADRVLVLSKRPGRIITDLPIDLPRPRKQGMITHPNFTHAVAQLLKALGIQV